MTNAEEKTMKYLELYAAQTQVRYLRIHHSENEGRAAYDRLYDAEESLGMSHAYPGAGTSSP